MVKPITRREWLAGAGASVAIAGAATPLRAAAVQPFFRRHNLSIGLQIYTLSDMATADLAGTLKAVAGIGYRTIELAGYYGRTPTELRRAIYAAGLACPSAHFPARGRGDATPALDGDLAALARDAHVLGVGTIIMPSFLFPDATAPRGTDEKMLDYMARASNQMTAEDWKRNAAFLNRAGAALAREGLRFGYHNHNPEFAPLAGGRTGMDILLRETDPGLVGFEMDAGWVAAAGQDPVALLRRHPGRFRQMHVKDIKPSTRTNYAFRQDATEVGRGKIDWKRILPAAFAEGVRGFFVEQEPPFVIDRLAAVGTSYRYLDTLSD